MNNKSISWKEGMFLLPQHFQGQENYFDDQLAANARVDHPYAYGFRELKVDATAFEDWKLTVTQAAGRTHVGTPIRVYRNEIPTLDLRTCDDGEAKQKLDRNEAVPIYLAISTVKPNTKNITASNEASRFQEFEDEVYDLHTGNSNRKIVFKKLKAVLTSSNQRGLDYEYLRIGTLELTESGGGKSLEFQPPIIHQ